MSAVKWEDSDSRERLWDCMIKLGAGELANSVEGGWHHKDAAAFAERVGKFALALMKEHAKLVSEDADTEALKEDD